MPSGDAACVVLGIFEGKDEKIKEMDRQDIVNQNEQFLKIFRSIPINVF